MENFYKELSDLTSKAYEMNDEQLAEKCNMLFKKIPADTTVNTASLNRIIAKRVVTYCKLNNIPVELYNGPLPYKQFKIDIK